MSQSSLASEWEGTREAFPLLKRYRYFDSGSFGIPSHSLMQAQVDYLRFVTDFGYTSPEAEEFLQAGRLPAGAEETYSTLPTWRGIDALRSECARILACGEDSIVWCDNTTQAFRTLLSYVDWGNRKHVVTTDMEHDSMLNVLELFAERSGVEVDQVGIRDLIGQSDFTARLAERLSDRTVKGRTQLVLFSHIFYSCGILVDPHVVVDAINRECPDAMVVIDGAHALGQLPLRVNDYGCDGYVTGGSKWLLAPPGTGMLCLGRRQNKLIWPTDSFQAIPPAIWKDRRRQLDYMNEDSPPVLGVSPYPLIGLNAALNQYSAKDPTDIWDRIRTLREAAASRLGKVRNLRVEPTNGNSTGLILLTSSSWTAKQAVQLAGRLSGRGSIVRAMKKPPALRVSIHYFNNEKDVEQLVDDLQTVA